MCGIAGFIDFKDAGLLDEGVLARMTSVLVHRGPDSAGYFTEPGVGLGFRRLAIIDPLGGDQPIFNEDGSVVLICNGEIFNYRELRAELMKRNHTFKSNCDVEVLAHLYEESAAGFLNQLNGQFAFAIYDRRRKSLLLARDHFGINPLFYTIVGSVLIFASEIKAILQHPLVRPEVNLTGLDQIMSLPGLVSPQTMFKGIFSLKSGHSLLVSNGEVRVSEYWDLDYPLDGEVSYDKPESYYVEQLAQLFERSVAYRLQADVPVGFYLSGGLDSSMIASMISRLSTQKRHAFSISFTEAEISERQYHKLMAEHVNADHRDINFGWQEISERLRDMIYHCECPVKETYNTCSMALSEAARRAGVPVVLTGEGADELFAGYVGYRFDSLGLRNGKRCDPEALLEEEFRERFWGDKNLFYETDQTSLREIKGALYATDLYESFEEFDCLATPLVNRERLRNRHSVHQRSYLDFKLRLSDHLIGDHGDRMALANSVEARYPFLDIDLIEFSRTIPPDLKLNHYVEKYILRKVAEDLVPRQILAREKYGFHAPGSPYLMSRNEEWINDLLSYSRIKQQGVFNPDAIEHLKKQYTRKGFKLNLPFESDLLAIVMTFGVFLDTFELPSLN